MLQIFRKEIESKKTGSNLKKDCNTDTETATLRELKSKFQSQ